jgi:hypothetical protein
MPPAERVSGRSAEEIRAVIEAFLQNCRQPVLLEPGEELLPIDSANFDMEIRGSRLSLQAWDSTRSLTRRVMGVGEAAAGKLELVVERFARREGRVFLLDAARRSGADLSRRSGRLVLRERFRLLLRRQFVDWTLAELSTEPNLQHSLSPAYPRAFLRHGQHGWAAIICPPEGDAGAAVSFGLIWLAYLRARQPRMAIGSLAIYVPDGREKAAALRLLCLDAPALHAQLFRYTEQDFVTAVDARDHGNVDTRLEPCRRLEPNLAHAFAQSWGSVLELPGVESVPRHDGRISLRVRGVEFAEISAEGELLFGLEERRRAGAHHVHEIARLAEELDRWRSAGTAGHAHPLYRQSPEAWLESQARAQIETLDATLLREPVYGQVPAFAGGERGILDLLAVDRDGRLAVIELKASADLHLPLQALDYWIRVKWHLDRGEFARCGYFPGVALRNEAPRLLLVAPSLEFHPTTETILRFFSPSIDVERIGLGVEWRRGLEVMFRLRGAERPR